MHRFRLAFIAISFFAAPLCAATLAAQQPDQLFTATRTQLDVTKVLLAQSAAWNHADLDAYMGFYKNAPDTEAILAGEVRGVQSIKNAYLINFPNAQVMGTLDETEVNVRELGENFALVTGRYHLTRTKKAGGDAEGLFTDIFEKTTRGWKIVYSATT